MRHADLLILVSDRSNPVWRNQRAVVLEELCKVGCAEKHFIEVWNKIDKLDSSNQSAVDQALAALADGRSAVRKVSDAFAALALSREDSSAAAGGCLTFRDEICYIGSPPIQLAAFPL